MTQRKGIFIAEAKQKEQKGLVERVKGIEPSRSAWEAEVLPLNYTRDVNQIIKMRPAYCQTKFVLAHVDLA